MSDHAHIHDPKVAHMCLNSHICAHIVNEPARRPQARGASLTQGVYPGYTQKVSKLSHMCDILTHICKFNRAYSCQITHTYMTTKSLFRNKKCTHFPVLTLRRVTLRFYRVAHPVAKLWSVSRIPDICHFFTLAKFLENKIYTEKRQFFALNL